MSTWRGVSAFAPLAGLVLGFLAPFLWTGQLPALFEPLGFMAVLIAGSILSGLLGLTLLGGYLLGDLLGGATFGQRYASYPGLLEAAGSQLISYLLLAIPVVQLPRLARALSCSVPERAAMKPAVNRVPGAPGRLLPPVLAHSAESPPVGATSGALVYPLACGVLVYLWCQGLTLLIRPIFTWGSGLPTARVMEHAPGQWAWLVAAAVLAALARVALERAARRRARGAAAVAMEQLSGAWSARRGAKWRRLPVSLRISLAAGVVSLLLSGAYTHWTDGLLVGAAAVCLGTWRTGLLGRFPAGFVRTVQRAPALPRFVVAPLLGYLVAVLTAGAASGATTVSPALLGMLV
ncbi:MAG: hypothetical protein IT307_13005, partial [Chloroflexi bacterium]|nr:hypothetical protein [Chloroflexota bacterium]